MSRNKLFTFARLFVAGLFLCTLAFSTHTQDSALAPRYCALVFILLLVNAYLLFSGSKKKLSFDLLTVSYGVYLLFTLLSVSWALNPSEAFFAATKTVLGGLVFFTAVQIMDERGQVERSILPAAFFAVFCFLVLLSVSIFQAYQAVDKGGMERLSSIIITGLNSNKNLLASALYLLIAFTALGALHTKGSRRILFGSCMLLMSLFIFYLGTRAVLLALGMVLLLSILAAGRSYWKFGKLLAVLLVSMSVFTAADLTKNDPNRYGEDEMLNSTSLKVRMEVWDKSIPMITDHLWGGVGAGNWKIYFPLYGQNDLQQVNADRTIFQTPHNDFLQVMAETGIFAAFFLFLFYGGLFYFAFRRRAQLFGMERRLITALMTFLAGYMVISFFDFPAQRPEHLVYSNLLLAWLYVMQRKVPEKGNGWKMNAGPFSAVNLLFLAFCMYLGVKRYIGEKNTVMMKKFRAMGNLQQVVNFSTKARSTFYVLDPVSIPLEWYKGNALAALGRLEDAKHSFEAAHRDHPYQIYVLGDLATAETMAGNVEKAKEYYQKALDIYPSYDDGNKNLAILYLNEGKPGEAINYMKRVSETGRQELFSGMVDAEPVPIYSADVKQLMKNSLPANAGIDYLKLKLGRKYFIQKNWRESLYWYSSTTAVNEEKADRLFSLAEQFKTEGREEAEVAAWQHLITLQPTDKKTTFYLIRRLIEYGEKTRARELLTDFPYSLTDEEANTKAELLEACR